MYEIYIAAVIAVGIGHIAARLIANYFWFKLPFYEARVVASDLRRLNGMVLVFEVMFENTASTIDAENPDHRIGFMLAGRIDSVVADSPKCKRLKKSYAVGKTIKVHYVPRFRSLFGNIPEESFFRSENMLMFLVGALEVFVIAVLLR